MREPDHRDYDELLEKFNRLEANFNQHFARREQEEGRGPIEVLDDHQYFDEDELETGTVICIIKYKYFF